MWKTGGSVPSSASRAHKPKCLQHFMALPLLLQAVVQAVNAIMQPDKEALHEALQELVMAIKEMTDALKKMHGNNNT